MFYKKVNICHVLFAFLRTNCFLITGLFQKVRHILQGSQHLSRPVCFPAHKWLSEKVSTLKGNNLLRRGWGNFFRILFRRGQNNFDRVICLENVSVAFDIANNS